MINNSIFHSDSLELLPLLNDESIDLTFTSPPYFNVKEYSNYSSYEEYLEFLKSIFSKVNRVTKEGRILVVNTSPILVPRTKRSESSTRYPIPFDLHNILTSNGWTFKEDIIWKKPEASVKNRNGGFSQTRYPLAYNPNLVTEYIMVYRKKTDKLIDWNINQYSKEIKNESKVDDGYETTNVWEIAPVYNKEHPAVFPSKLCEKIIKYYSYLNDVIFDPFGGSGTVAKVALRLNRRFIISEKSLDYIQVMKKDLLLKEKASFLTLSDLS